MATAFEKSTPAIPGTDNMNLEHASSLQRVHDYPVVKQTLETAYNLVQSNSVASYVYDTATSLAAKVLASTEPLQQRLPLEKVDVYANQTLDFVEKKFPVVKEDTNVIFQKVRGPADSAVGLGKAYADGFQSRLSPATEAISKRIADTQDTLKALQDKVTAILANVPHDRAGAQAAVDNLYKEVDGLKNYLTKTFQELPTTAQTTAKPYLDGLNEGVNYLQEELSKDLPLTTKATNVLNYTKDMVSPILVQIKELIVKVKVEAESAAPAPNGSS